MVSRGHQTTVAARSGWTITVAWSPVFVAAIALTVQTATFIAHNGLVAARRPFVVER